jgi:hypothetical protein
LYDCDTCGRPTPPDQLRHLWAFGIETFACARCCGDEEDDGA